jgi:hypothetical protein
MTNAEAPQNQAAPGGAPNPHPGQRTIGAGELQQVLQQMGQQQQQQQPQQTVSGLLLAQLAEGARISQKASAVALGISCSAALLGLAGCVMAIVALVVR